MHSRSCSFILIIVAQSLLLTACVEPTDSQSALSSSQVEATLEKPEPIIIRSVVLGTFSRYCGKVNIHKSPCGGWITDSDCTSGCNIGGLAYCQKFWPNATSVRQVALSAKANNVWSNAGCRAVVDDWDGTDEFECLSDI
jgi:hypothetical protein